jgi:hypothetical protein
MWSIHEKTRGQQSRANVPLSVKKKSGQGKLPRVRARCPPNEIGREHFQTNGSAILDMCMEIVRHRCPPLLQEEKPKEGLHP